MIPSVLALAFVSMALVLVAVAQRSRSVATLNFIICLFSAPAILPWFPPTMHPPDNEDLRVCWIAGVIWIFIFSASVLALIYCVIAHKLTSEASRGKHGKRRRRRSRSSGVAPAGQEDQGDSSSASSGEGGV
jgi:hypothetical protein